MKTAQSSQPYKFTTGKFSCLLLMILVGFSACKPSGEITRTRPFDADWRFLRDSAPGAETAVFDDSGWSLLDLPHDWSIEDIPAGDTAVTGTVIGPFSSKSPGGMSTGHVLGGTGWYRKHFTLDKEDAGKYVSIQFDGVYMNSDVWINGHHLGNHPYGYTSFAYNLTPFLKPAGEENLLAVRVINHGRNSRWYSGSGIYRHVWLTVTDPVHIAQWGVSVTTPEVDTDSSWINILTQLENTTDEEANLVIHTNIIAPTGEEVADLETPAHLEPNAGGEACQFIHIFNPVLWSTENPGLYSAHIEVLQEGKVIDRFTQTFGIRSVEFSASQGLLLNGSKLLLRGGCMHHDNGPLGSATIDRAEERRVELMKAFGFNAIRTSHNPPSPAFLDACDRLGILVIDEAFDMWERGKNPDDYHLYFKEWWQHDIASMVLRDRNHPSIILWSIGNEIPERGDTSGIRIGKQLADEVRRLDPYRKVTAAICEFWDWPGHTWDETAPAFTMLDVGGYNYQYSKYVSDHARYPERIMVGTESVPQDAFENWQAVEQNAYVIGDFVWTSMDYLGESGIGNARLDDEKLAWPWFNANCGDIDICGFKKPQSYFRDVVWRIKNIAMAVHTPLPEGRKELVSWWGWPDEVQSWTWPGMEGKIMQVNVYSRCNTVRLELNGTVIGTKTVSDSSRLRTTFEVPYAPGKLMAIGLSDNRESDTITFSTTGPATAIRLTPDRSMLKASRNDLAYILIEAVDDAGNLVPNASLPVSISVIGVGELAAVGNANPKEMSSFKKPLVNTYRGRCLAIVRPKGKAGLIKIEARSEGMQPVRLQLRTR